MKLLFDENLSPRLCDRLRDIWIDTVHVRTVGLRATDDSAIWAFARQRGFTIVSKDGDFSARASVHGAPPKVVWLTVGNCSTDEIEWRLRNQREEIEAFAVEAETALFVIGVGSALGSA